MLSMKTETHYEAGGSVMPNRPSVMQPRFRQENCEANLPRAVAQENTHLPEIRDSSSRTKTDRKSSRFLSFPNERQSFTENLISFFTGNRDRLSTRAPSRPAVSKKPVPSSKKDEKGLAGEDIKPHKTRINPALDARIDKTAGNHKLNGRHAPIQRHKHPPLKRTDSRKKITAAAKDDVFRPVTSNSTKPTENEKVTDVDADSDIGGYETMYKTKQPAVRAGRPRKRSVELSEYLRKENYKYNERIAKQFLFQKWLKSTESEFPEQIATKGTE